MSYYTSNTLKIANVNIPRLAQIPITDKSVLVCTAYLRGYMPDHLSTFSYFARYTAQALSLPVSPIIHGPTDIEKWWMSKGPFVHAKKKEIFEKKEYVRILQIYDGNRETVGEWVKQVSGKLPAGVEMKVEEYEWEAENVDIQGGQKSNFDEKVRKRAAEILAQLSK